MLNVQNEIQENICDVYKDFLHRVERENTNHPTLTVQTYIF